MRNAQLPNCSIEGCGLQVLATQKRVGSIWTGYLDFTPVDDRCYNHSEKTCATPYCRKPKGKGDCCPTCQAAQTRIEHKKAEIQARRQKQIEKGNLDGKVRSTEVAVSCPICDRQWGRFTDHDGTYPADGLRVKCQSCEGLFLFPRLGFKGQARLDFAAQIDQDRRLADRSSGAVD